MGGCWQRRCVLVRGVFTALNRSGGSAHAWLEPDYHGRQAAQLHAGLVVYHSVEERGERRRRSRTQWWSAAKEFRLKTLDGGPRDHPYP